MLVHASLHRKWIPQAGHVDVLAYKIQHPSCLNSCLNSRPLTKPQICQYANKMHNSTRDTTMMVRQTWILAWTPCQIFSIFKSGLKHSPASFLRLDPHISWHQSRQHCNCMLGSCSSNGLEAAATGIAGTMWGLVGNSCSHSSSHHGHGEDPCSSSSNSSPTSLCRGSRRTRRLVSCRGA